MSSIPSRPRVDVLIPAYNAEATVVQAVDSIRNQSVADLRIVIVDDGSTDGTAAKLAALAQADARIVLLRQANGGIVSALNAGLELCSGEYVARHDADDIAYSGRLAAQLAYLDSHPDCVAVGANARHVDAAGVPWHSTTEKPDPAGADPAYFPSIEPYLMHPLLVVRRAALVAVGGYRYVFHAEDTDLYWRLAAVGRLHNMPDILADYRIHAGSVSGKSVLNGRVQAIHSQLAAVSEMRRRKGVQDLAFPADRIRLFHEARTLDAMMNVAEEQLTDAERGPFRLAVAAKVLELACYRPYRLEQTDRRYVLGTLNRYAGLPTPANREELRLREAKHVVALLRRGKIGAAATFARPAVFVTTVGLFRNWVRYKFKVLFAP